MGATTKQGLPPRISRCWRYNGYHALGAGPCFDTVEQAVAHRDRELEQVTEMCERKKDRWCYYDFDAKRDVTWGEQWDAHGWPDLREIREREGW